MGVELEQSLFHFPGFSTFLPKLMDQFPSIFLDIQKKFRTGDFKSFLLRLPVHDEAVYFKAGRKRVLLTLVAENGSKLFAKSLDEMLEKAFDQFVE